MNKRVRMPRSTIAVFGLLAIVLGLLNLGYADAQIHTCRTDPIVTLSNGVQVTMYEDVGDVATDITAVNYQLHVPGGVSIKAISYPGDVPASLQRVRLYQDANSGNYDAYTVVSTATPNISVTAYMSASSSSTSTVSAHTSGQSGQSLHSHLHLC